jgi:hypothetical protein
VPVSLTAFERSVLRWVCDDYESIESIREDLTRELGRPVAEAERFAALLTVVHTGLVDAVVHDEALLEFRGCDPEAAARSELWFLANAEGRAEYECSNGRFERTGCQRGWQLPGCFAPRRPVKP